MKSARAAADASQAIPAVTIETLDGHRLDTGSLGNGGKAFVIVLWATGCAACRAALDGIATQYAAWNADYGAVVFAVAVDGPATAREVAGVVAAHGWPYAFSLDTNQDFQRALGVDAVPHVFVADGNRQLVYSHNDYEEGDERVFGEQLRRLSRV